MADESPEAILARHIIEDGRRDRLAMFDARLNTPDELVDLITAYPEHREWLLDELKNKIDQGDGDDEP